MPHKQFKLQVKKLIIDPKCHNYGIFTFLYLFYVTAILNIYIITYTCFHAYHKKYTNFKHKYNYYSLYLHMPFYRVFI